MAAIIDSVIIVLLIGSITYGYLVSRKVRLLMATLRDLQPLVEEFSTAVDKSRDSVSQMRESIEVAELSHQSALFDEETEAHPAPFSSRRAPAPAPEMPGMRVVRDKKELVRAFFEHSGTAKV